MTRIKVCGLTRREDILAVNEALPDYCGFVIDVPGSRRNCSPLMVKEMVCLLDKRVRPVGVFVNAPVRLPALLLREGTIFAAQLHGGEDEDYIRELRRLAGKDARIMKAFSIGSREDVEESRRSTADYVLLDQGKGGTGKTFDWSLAGGLDRPFFLAGGLSLENMAEAIRLLKPYGVDLSSSLEKDGRKDPEKIKKAVELVRSLG
ncbi:MAG: phosphoribosylanthranilate isomerase [Eubacteriales bacterium]|nr:phosphoribosylanthranilate isomerase [Eubacteriales bacterium]